ncbi:hypothetical protein PIB30_103618 [Stylosanthes scabra]|uniref:Uncharacterized protein n=1 Tax=Stylosanthes scabra TaxID=79078 RepID=A0ABU6RYZ8_9FABA|nr:hypothetical protein [Stylosanthes scabra]
MPRSKKTTPKRQRQNEDVVYMEPPSDHPLFQYFSRLDDLNNYIFNFSERIVISPSSLRVIIQRVLGMLTYGLESLNTWALMLVVKVGEEFLKTTSSMNEKFIIWEGVWKKAKNNNHLHHLKSKLLKNKPVLPSNLQ